MNILNNLKSNLFYSTTLNFNTNKYNNHFFYFKKINSAYKKLFAVILTTQHSFHSTKSGSSKSQHNTASAPKEQKHLYLQNEQKKFHTKNWKSICNLFETRRRYY